MLKNNVLKQKQEKERLLSLPYIERTKAAEAKKWLNSSLIKVILGPRRAGKSIFSLSLLKNLSFAYFNFDDEDLPGQKKFNYDELIQELHAAYGPTKNILFDEIQNLPQWELFVNRLQREGYNLTLTGSNARLLSKELSTALTGRHIPIEILPFSFREFLLAKNYATPTDMAFLPEKKGELLQLLQQYMLNGGYPEVTIQGLDPKGYLTVLFDSVLFKDVVKRHKVRFIGDIDNLGSYFVNNVTHEYTLRKTANLLGFRSGITLEKYVSYLTEAYLLFSLNRYSYKTGERLKSPKKIYLVDNGIITAKAVQHSPDTGKFLENLVFVELIKRSFVPNRNLFYYKTRNDREVDFLLKNETSVTELIQVAYQTDATEAEKREIKALLEAGSELSCDNLLIITWNTEKVEKRGGKEIKFIPSWKWLLE